MFSAMLEKYEDAQDCAANRRIGELIASARTAPLDAAAIAELSALRKQRGVSRSQLDKLAAELAELENLDKRVAEMGNVPAVHAAAHAAFEKFKADTHAEELRQIAPYVGNSTYADQVKNDSRRFELSSAVNSAAAPKMAELFKRLAATRDEMRTFELLRDRARMLRGNLAPYLTK